VAPQNSVLVVGSMQEPSHSTRPAGQLSTQVPWEQTLPASHGLPHAPQFSASLSTAIHSPSQISMPRGHDSVIVVVVSVLPSHAMTRIAAAALVTLVTIQCLGRMARLLRETKF
jgi:hypothetical protein